MMHFRGLLHHQAFCCIVQPVHFWCIPEANCICLHFCTAALSKNYHYRTFYDIGLKSARGSQLHCININPPQTLTNSRIVHPVCREPTYRLLTLANSCELLLRCIDTYVHTFTTRMQPECIRMHQNAWAFSTTRMHRDARMQHFIACDGMHLYAQGRECEWPRMYKNVS